MRVFKTLTTTALVCAGIVLFTPPSPAAEEESFEDLESNYSYTLSEGDDAVIKLDPINLEGRAVDVELLSAPNPRTNIDFVNLESDPYENGRGVEIIEFSIPIE